MSGYRVTWKLGDREYLLTPSASLALEIAETIGDPVQIGVVLEMAQQTRRMPPTKQVADILWLAMRREYPKDFKNFEEFWEACFEHGLMRLYAPMQSLIFAIINAGKEPPSEAELEEAGMNRKARRAAKKKRKGTEQVNATVPGT